jgi:hypothetical protein
MIQTYLPNSKLLTEAVTHNDRKLLYHMAESLTGGQPTVTWKVVPLESMPDAEEAPSAQ